MKCEEAGVDAVVAEGFEAGGHNGREETTTFCLIPAHRRCNCSIGNFRLRALKQDLYLHSLPPYNLVNHHCCPS